VVGYSESESEHYSLGISMARIYKKHGSKFKAKVALQAIKEKKTLGELSQEYSVASTQISTWKKHLEDGSPMLFEGKQEKNHQEEIDRLHGVIGRITAERDFLERALNR
jgi:transposase